MVGRDDELAAALLAVEQRASGGGGRLVVRGEAGIGKTTLLESVVAACGERRVLRTVGVEPEQHVPLAGLIGLFGPDAGDQTGLDDHHADTLRAALGAGELVPPLKLGLAVLHLVSRMVADGPVMIVVDDAQWLDELSTSALSFALRRLEAEDVALVVAVRASVQHPFEGLPTLDLEGLDQAAAGDLLRASVTVDGAVAAACWRACGGNPLALIELARSLSDDERAGARALPDLLAVAPRIADSFAARIGELSARSNRALVVAAAAGPVEPEVLSRALHAAALEPEDLVEAEAAGVLVRRDGRVELAHPLWRHAALSRMAPAERRGAHRLVADALPANAIERRAWHLAEACDGADEAEEAVDALDQVARRASEKGSHVEAAAAWEQASRLARDTERRVALLGSAGTARWDATQTRPALALLRRAFEDAPSARSRAPVTVSLGNVIGWSSSIDEALRLLTADAALVEVEDPEMAVALLLAASTLAGLGAQAPVAVELAQRAEEVAQRCDELLRFAARALVTHSRLIRGEGAALGEQLAEVELLDALVDHTAGREVVELAQLLGFDLMVRERWAEAADLLGRVAAAGRHANLVGVANFALVVRAEVAWREGRWSEARSEALNEVAFHQTNEHVRAGMGDATLAKTEAALGLVDSAAEHARRCVEQGEHTGMTMMTCTGRHALGFLALSLGDHDGAYEQLEWVWKALLRGQMEDPGVLWFHGDLLEVLSVTGRTSEMGRFVDQLERQAAATGGCWAAAMATRGRGLLGGDAEQLARSVDLLDRMGAPFEAARGRVLLADLGSGAASREALADALDTFELLGAEPWIRQLRSRAGQAPRAVAPPAVAALLSPAELRVALAVGRGLTNRETADELSLSPKTVDAHLRTIYRKLDIDSRTKLALRVNTVGPHHRAG